MLVLFAVLPGICEELLFRAPSKGYLDRARHPGRDASSWGAYLGFSTSVWLEFFLPASHQILLCYTAWRSRSIFIPILIHCLHNGVVLVLSHRGMVESPPSHCLIFWAAVQCVWEPAGSWPEENHGKRISSLIMLSRSKLLNLSRTPGPIPHSSFQRTRPMTM